MVSPLERRLLVYSETPSAVSAEELITELALAKQSLTFERRELPALALYSWRGWL